MKKSISVLLSVCIILTTLMSGVVTAFAEGNIIPETNITWSFNTETKVLTFEGEGSIPDYNEYITDGEITLEYPWKDVEYTKIVFGPDITGIGNYAFCYSSTLQSVEIPETVAVLGEGIFMGCSALETVTLPASVNRVNESTFANCKKLKNVTLSPITQSIGKEAFTQCKALEEITFPATLKTIDEAAFAMCTSLKKALLPEGFTTLGARAFYSCEKLAEFTLPSTLKTIKESALDGCRAIKTITFPDSITMLPANVCNGCRALEAVTLPKNLTEIGEGAFNICPSLKEITIPATVTSIGKKAIGYGLLGAKVVGFTINGYANTPIVVYAEENDFIFKSLGYVTSGTCNDKVTWEYNEEAKTLYIKGEGATPNYKSTDFVAFNLIPFEKVVVGEKITKIGSYMFYNAPAADFTLPVSVESIGENAIGYYDKKGTPTLREGTAITGYEKTIAVTYAANNNLKFNSLGNFVATEGKLTDEISWVYDKESKTLVVSGTGAIPGYTPDAVPFAEYEIQTILVSEGITSIGDHAFLTNKPCAAIKLNSDLTEIGEKSFGYTVAEKMDEDGNLLGEYEVTVNPEFTVRGYIATPADEYASFSKFKFEALDGDKYPLFSLIVKSVIDHVNKFIIIYSETPAKAPDAAAIMAAFPSASFSEVKAPEVFGTGNEFTVVNANGSYTYKIVVRGDNNGDGKINSSDALAVLKHSVQSAVMEDSSKLNASDLDGNGTINSSDALAILQISVGTKDITKDYNPGVVK